jgi:glycosyltransferase involved in cell wall biosynthesis
MKQENHSELNTHKKQVVSLEKRIQELTAQLTERDAELIEHDSKLAQIYMSKEWKLAQLLRRIVLWLAPPNSWRERIGRFLISYIMEIDFLWELLFRRPKQKKVGRHTTTKLPAVKENKTKPKIGYVIPGTAISGGVAVVCEHVNRLIRRGYDVSIVSEDNLDRIAWFPNQLAPVIPLGQILEENYDILVATGWTTAYTVQRLEADRKFYFVQSDESRFYPPGDFREKRAKKTYKMDFEFITMAKWLQNWLKKECGKNSTYIPNGINENIIFPDNPIKEKGETVRVLLEGSINIPYKGMSDAFMAVNGLSCEVWCVSSSGRPKPEWKCDKFFGKVPYSQMRHIYSSCDILLKMSRVESFSYPPLEMMACGGTTVVGKVTGIDEYVVDGYNALVVEQGDIQGARKALKELIENAKLRNELIENGKKTAEKFRWDPSIDRLEDVFIKETVKLQ